MGDRTTYSSINCHIFKLVLKKKQQTCHKALATGTNTVQQIPRKLPLTILPTYQKPDLPLCCYSSSGPHEAKFPDITWGGQMST